MLRGLVNGDEAATTITQKQELKDEYGEVAFISRNLDLINLLKDYSDSLNNQNIDNPSSKEEARWIIQQAGVEITKQRLSTRHCFVIFTQLNVLRKQLSDSKKVVVELNKFKEEI